MSYFFSPDETSSTLKLLVGMARSPYFFPAQVAVLQEERNSLLAENDVLTDRANQLDTFDDPSTPSGRKHSQLQQQLETLQEENFRFVLSS